MLLAVRNEMHRVFARNPEISDQLAAIFSNVLSHGDDIGRGGSGIHDAAIQDTLVGAGLTV